ncbi:MAG: FKBP-type peptidyl-prolyl cis-trans isomerase [Candidatus Krumholzibacteriia bacterium]
MTQAQKGDQVKVHYTGRLTDGTVFDSSREREPLAFEVGGEGLIAGFSNGVVGMEVGQQITVTIEPEEGYGPATRRWCARCPWTPCPRASGWATRCGRRPITARCRSGSRR